MNNEENNEQLIPSADNSALFGTTSSDIVEGLHQNAFPRSSSPVPEEDDQIVNAQDQQKIVNPDEEELRPDQSATSVTLDNLPHAEKDLFDKNMLGLPGRENIDDIKEN
ncbi:MAG: hypothetical protein ABI151_16675 [Chitinophagaceae bacterium]